jgi:hypothetical protein
MSERSDALRRRAEQCEAAAARVRDPEISAVYLATAFRWRRMADQQDEIDRGLSEQRFGGINPAK